MRRLLVSAHVTLLCILALTAPADAGLEWCDGDPVVELGGTRVRILVSVPAEAVAGVNGPVEVEIATPKGIERRLIASDPGFNGHGEVVRFTDSRGRGTGKALEGGAPDGFRVRVRVRIPLAPDEGSPKAIPVRVTAMTGDGLIGQAYGTSRGTRLKILLPDR